jgi:hypothetical protein
MKTYPYLVDVNLLIIQQRKKGALDDVTMMFTQIIQNTQPLKICYAPKSIQFNIAYDWVTALWSSVVKYAQCKLRHTKKCHKGHQVSCPSGPLTMGK